MRLYKVICFFLIAYCLLPTVNCFAQVKVNGVVKDKEKGEVLIGATVVLKGTTTGAVTDIDGKFELTVPLKPPFTLTVSYMGYVTQEFVVENPQDKLKFKLPAETVMLEDVKVVAKGLSERQKKSPLTIESMNIAAIKATPSADFYEGLGHLKGVDLISASIGFKVINTRGFNSTSPVRSLQIIDGVDNQSPGLSFSLGNFLGASELDVLNVDLVVGASSAFYGPNAFNGVISMTTKSPFVHPGLSAMTKVGERGLFESSIRWAQVFKNKEGEEKFAYKFNLFWLRVNDWEADNMDPTDQSLVGSDNYGRYDAVNRYGDEEFFNFGQGGNVLSSTVGLGRYYRDGYRENVIVDYNTRNIKLGTALHYKLKPDVELIFASNFGTGTTVYQGDNRYSLKDILFFQNRLELKKEDKFFIRVYATNEDAGKSYDAFFTALLIQDAAKDNSRWIGDYQLYWKKYIEQSGLDMPGDWPVCDFLCTGEEWKQVMDSINKLLIFYSDSLIGWHQETRDVTNTAFSDGIIEINDVTGLPNVDRFEPGTARFDSVFNKITSTPLSKGGTKFIDNSALYHVHGEYKLTPNFMDIIVGGNYRLYVPDSRGTIFSDTGDIKITNKEFGLYTGFEKKIWDEKLKLNLTTRLDKNENFDYLVSPAASAVFSHKNNHIRFSFSSAIRNPTLADQYLYYNVGPAILLGNINGFDSSTTSFTRVNPFITKQRMKLVTIESFNNYRSGTALNKDTLEIFKIDPIMPEKVKSIEVGYRTTLFNRLYLDASYYYSFYKDFIGFNLGADIELDSATAVLQSIQVYRVAANATDIVTTQGFSVGANYYFNDYFSLNGNYSWNILNKKDSLDPIIPAFNTPEHKYNVGISGNDINTKIGALKIKHWGFSINYKWVKGFLFEGSPQFTGFIPTYDMLDVQINKVVPAIKTTFKLGASNVLNNKKFQVYGGPRIGRLAYFSVLVEI